MSNETNPVALPPVFPSSEPSIFRLDEHGFRYGVISVGGWDQRKSDHKYDKTSNQVIRFAEILTDGNALPGVTSQQLVSILIDRAELAQQNFHTEEVELFLMLMREARDTLNTMIRSQVRDNYIMGETDNTL